MQATLQLGGQSAEEFQLPQLEGLQLQLRNIDKQLLTLRFAFGTLKKNIEDAFSPLAVVLLPMVNRGLYAAAQAVKTFGQVVAGLLGVQVAQDKVTASVKKSTAARSAWAKRTLAAFDQINRLQGSSGGGSSAAADQEPQLRLFPTGLTDSAKQLLGVLSQMLAPLKELDLSAAHWSFERLREALQALSDAAKEAFLQLWDALLLPLAGFLVEQLAPAMLDAITAAVYLAAELVDVFGDSMVLLLEKMAPVADFLGRALVEVICRLEEFFQKAANAIYSNGSQIEGVFLSIGQALEAFWTVAGDFLERLLERFSNTSSAIGDVVIRGIENALMAIGDFFYSLTAMLYGDMQNFWDGLEKMCRHGANAVITVANALLRTLTAAVNTLFDAFNSIEFEMPDWLPIYGGKKFHFSLRSLSAPQIPYLAQGAVLPANQPFLAVVGDQKHGTNIEAPLTTIQEAVALTVGDLAAGQAAAVSVLTDILQAVLGISIGDEQVAAAVDRCYARRAVMRGGLGC